MTSRRDSGAAPSQERSVLSHLFTKGITWKLVKTNPVSGSQRQAEANENPRPLTLEEESRLMACLPKGMRVWPSWRELVTLDVNTGLRLNEL